jgi:hypothetical protein
MANESAKMSDERKNKAEELFSTICRRWMASQSTIASFRETVVEGVRRSADTIARQAGDFVQWVITTKEMDHIFLDKEAFFNKLSPEKLVDRMTTQAIESAQNSIDAASIVFAHSVLDGVVFDYCRVVAFAAPEDWEDKIKDKNVALREVKESSYDALFQAKLDKYLTEIEKDSLKTKIELLLSRCKPPEKFNPIDDYKFDIVRIEDLDRLRIEIIHGEALGKEVKDASKNVEYLLRTCVFLMALVNQKYELRIDPSKFFNQPK